MKVHSISALQSEYSLFEREVEAEVLPTCRELGIGFVPYSPLGRGLITGKVKRAEEYVADNDNRRSVPRFQGENFDRNMKRVDAVTTLAAKKGLTPGQLALAWLLDRGDDIVPIPGTDAGPICAKRGRGLCDPDGRRSGIPGKGPATSQRRAIFRASDEDDRSRVECQPILPLRSLR